MNWKEVRRQFPVTEKYIYFDLANKCALPLFSTNIISNYINKQQEFSGSKDEWFEMINETRSNFAEMININPAEIAFTKNTSEGLNIAANCLPLKAGDTVILNENEHPNNVYCWLNLKKKGIDVKFAPTHHGEVLVEDLAKITDKSTKVVAISSVNYAPGIRNNIKEIAKYCKEQGIYSVIDAVQSIGTLNTDVSDFGADILCTSGHKAMFCPHGVGVFYCRKELLNEIEPIYVARSGMGMSVQIEYGDIIYELNNSPDARKFEIGNYNYLGLSVFNESIKFLMAIGLDNVEKRILALNTYFVSRLTELGYDVASPLSGSKRSAIICFKSKNARELHQWLMDNKAITTLRRDMIRASLGIYNNEDDIDQLITLIKDYN